MDDDRRSPFDADMNNWQPRIGFAYAANSKTAIRGGYGLFYTVSRATVFDRPGTGFTINAPVLWTTDSNATPNRHLNNPFPDGILQGQVPNPFFGQITDSRSQLSGRTAQQFRLLRNMPQFDGASVGQANPARGNSVYHAMQAKWEKRFSRGFTGLVHYTWSKMIDDVSHSDGNVSRLGGSTSIQNIWNLRHERALSSHDIPHRAVITGMYELPFGKGRKFGSNMNRAVDWIAGGWGVSGMLLMQGGMPL